MHPTGPPPSQNRSCPSPSLAQCPSSVPSFLQQQHVIYGPITTLQACPGNLHSHCVYTGIQRSPGFTGTLNHLSSRVPIRHAKLTKWQPKSKPARGHHPSHHQQSHQQYYQALQQQQQQQQTQVHQPLSYIPKPLVLFDQCQANQPSHGLHPSSASFLVASSTFAHDPYGHSDHYGTSGSGRTLVPQPYYKPPEVGQAFCLLPERSQTNQQPLTAQNQASYYNVTATNACNVQAIKPSFHITNVPYGNLAMYENGQIPAGQSLPTNQVFQSPSLPFATSRDRPSILSDIDVQSVICTRNLTTTDDHKHQESIVPKSENVRWPLQDQETSGTFEAPAGATSSRVSITPAQTSRLDSSTIRRNQDERCSDESGASFDFTIEAEKMVSALCNTVSSNELGKDDNSVRNDTSSTFAAGDNLTNKTNVWFTDFCTEYGVSVGQTNRTASTQTSEDRNDSYDPETMRKTIYWGCNEAESILNTSYYRGNSRAAWLANVSSATRTAVTKSSTCFPVFTGDRTFVLDLINAILRISNGWLVLDNYLNKQYYPCIDEKFDRELTSHFKTWESVTQDLLGILVRTLVNLESNIASDNTSLENLGFHEHPSNASFPGDASLYTNNDLFVPLQRQQQQPNPNTCDWNERDSTRGLGYSSQSPTTVNSTSLESNHKSQKETKLRSKWTITENLSSMMESGKPAPNVSLSQSELGFSCGNRFRVRNSSNASSTKISSSRRSLNAEFFHLQNKVMASLGSSNEQLERQRWGLKEQRYDFVFGASRTPGNTIVPDFSEPIFKIRTAGSSYENAYAQRSLPTMNQSNTCEPSTSHCTSMNGSIYLVAGPETSLETTYLAGIANADSNESHAEPDSAGNVRIAELNEHNCGSDLVVSATNISSIKNEPVNAGKTTSDRRELATIPRTKMTLLSQIEGGATNVNRDPKEMTASLSAWFASMRNSGGHRNVNCQMEQRKNESANPRTSTHPQESSRSAIDLNRQLRMDANRQLQTLRNMQAIQSQPWNAANLLNNKKSPANLNRNLDEYDSSEDVRVYMKPGSYNVPKKRHHRKNNRKSDNPTSSRLNGNTPRSQGTRGSNGIYNSREKNDRPSGSVSSLLVASSIQVSTTTTTTSTSIAIPFSSAPPIVPPPLKFTPDDSPRILRRPSTRSNQETRQESAWKAACASAEILLEALNVRTPNTRNSESSPNSMKTINRESRDRQNGSNDRLSNETGREEEDLLPEASSYEASEDDSGTTYKLSPQRFAGLKGRDSKQSRTNVKTDSWLISTLNNASMIDTNAGESDLDSTIGESMNSSINEDHREYKKNVATSTPEPPKVPNNDDLDRSSIIPVGSFTDRFNEKSIGDSTRDKDNDSSGLRLQTAPGNLSNSGIESTGEFSGKATYSETVRRSAGKLGGVEKTDPRSVRQTRSMNSIEPTVRNTIIPILDRKCQKRDNDRGTSQTIHRSRKITTKKLSKTLEGKDVDDGRSNKKTFKEEVPGDDSTKPITIECRTKKKDDAGWTLTKSKVSERGWSVWYSSRRKQALGTLALNKLATIHRTVWQMDDAKLLKSPNTNISGCAGTTEMIDDDCRIKKSPIFLETIGYKLKNRIYYKIEHFVRDFRKIINNSKIHHKNDTDCVAKIETLSQRLEKLFDDHFANWDLENVSKSPRNNNGSSNVQTSRWKSPQRQKSTARRSTTSAKENSVSTTAKNEN